MSYSSYYKRRDNRVEEVALELRAFLDRDDIKNRINEVHRLNGKSQAIQRIIEPFLHEKRFVSERRGLFQDYNLRPDLFNADLKIIVEVERGRIKSNNMHLLDIWKCHLTKEASHLFLVIPNVRQRDGIEDEEIFRHIDRVASSFFEKGNYINIDSCYIFGY